MELAKCKVVFDQQAHTYTLGNKQLQGITSTLIKWMFPSTYDFISQDVLKQAAERGSFIHENIELADSLGVSPTACPEAMEYIKLRDEQGLKALSSEYLVTDNKNFASAIDIVYDDLSLADIKCTSKIHTDNVRLQLSIYAYLFEKMNKGLKAKRLLVVWLPKEQYGKPKIIEVERIKSSDIKKMIDAYLAGEPNTAFLPLFQQKNEVQLVSNDVISQIAAIEIKMAELKKQSEELRSTIRTAMELHNVSKWETEQFKVSLGKESVSKRFDAKAFQTDHPDLYEQYQVETTSKGKFTLTLKQ